MWLSLLFRFPLFPLLSEAHLPTFPLFFFLYPTLASHAFCNASPISMMAMDWERRLDRFSRLAAGPRAPLSWLDASPHDNPQSHPYQGSSPRGATVADKKMKKKKKSVSSGQIENQGKQPPVRILAPGAGAALRRVMLRRAKHCIVPRLVDLCAVVVATRTAELELPPAESMTLLPGEALSLVLPLGLRCAPAPAALLQRVRIAPEYRECLDLAGARLDEDDLRLILAPDEGVRRAKQEDRAWWRSQAGRRAQREHRATENHAGAPDVDVDRQPVALASSATAGTAATSALTAPATLAASPLAGKRAIPTDWEHLDDGEDAGSDHAVWRAVLTDQELYAPRPYAAAHIHTIKLSGCRSLRGGGAFTGILVSSVPHLRRLYLDDAFARPQGAQATLSALAHVSLPLLSHLDVSQSRLLVDKDLSVLYCPEVLPALHSFVAVDCPLLTPQRVRSLLYYRQGIRHAVTTRGERAVLFHTCARECSADDAPLARASFRRHDAASADAEAW